MFSLNLIPAHKMDCEFSSTVLCVKSKNRRDLILIKVILSGLKLLQKNT